MRLRLSVGLPQQAGVMGMTSPEENLQIWSSMSGAEAIASLLSNPPLAQHLATYARMMAEPDALALLRTVQFGSAPIAAQAQVRPCLESL